MRAHAERIAHAILIASGHTKVGEFSNASRCGDPSFDIVISFLKRQSQYVHASVCILVGEQHKFSYAARRGSSQIVKKRPNSIGFFLSSNEVSFELKEVCGDL